MSSACNQRLCVLITHKPASRSASVIASRVEGGTENPSASFSGSAFGSAAGGGSNGSFSSGIVSCVVPFIGAAVDSLSLDPVGPRPFGTSRSLEGGGRSGDGALSDSRLDERRLKGERGRSADEVGGGRSLSLSLFLFFPNPNAEPKFEDDFCSGEDARPYGCALCLRRPSTVPKRFNGFELCFSSSVNGQHCCNQV